MATGTITIVDASLAGTVDLLTGGALPTATDGDYLTTTGYELAWLYNGSGAPVTVTIDAFPSGGQGAPSGLTVTDPTVTVAAGAIKFFGPFPAATFGNASKQVKITVSTVTSCKIGGIRTNPTP
jgi:hypothetical protein